MDQSADFRVEVFLIGTKHTFCAQKRLVSFLILGSRKNDKCLPCLESRLEDCPQEPVFQLPRSRRRLPGIRPGRNSSRDLVQKLHLFLGSLGRYQFFFELFNIHPEGLE